MNSIRGLAYSALLLVMTASVSPAAQYHVPMHMPPHRCVPEGDSGRDFVLGVGVARVIAGGINVSGPGGYFERTTQRKSGFGFSARGYGFNLSGNVDPLSAGGRSGGGVAGGFELDVLWAPRGRESYRLYTGFITNLAMLSIADPLSFTFASGNVKVEPDTAFSITLGFPLGVLVPFDISKTWRGELQSDLTLFSSGVTLFSYLGLPASPLYGSTRQVDAHFGGGARLGAVYTPWSLTLEVLGRVFSGSGNNEPLSFTAAQAGIQF